jgi:signal transduction histidine kinase
VSGVLRIVVPATAGLLALTALFGPHPPDTGAVTTYAAGSTAAWVASDAALIALLGAGALLVGLGSAPKVGALALGTAICWWAPTLVGWEGAAPWPRSLAAVVAPLFVPSFVSLGLATTASSVRSVPLRALVAAGYVATATVSLIRAAVYDPLADPHCWSTCSDNVLLLTSHPRLASGLRDVELVIAGGLGLALAGVSLARLQRGRPARRAVAAAAMAAGAAMVGSVAALLVEPAARPTLAPFTTLFVICAATVAVLGAAVAWWGADVGRRRAALARLGSELGDAPAPGTLGPVLARHVGDPALEVGYWLAAEGRHVDAAGRPLALPRPGDGRATTAITRAGEPVAIVIHSVALLAGPGLEGQIGAAARLAVDNERLRAAMLARVADLRASRARIVERGDAERQRLERDLHDGAQQRLLALSYELRLARADACDDPVATATLDRTIDRASAALEELRELAHGIYPAILAQAGLGPAVATLADTAPIAISLGHLTEDRLPAPVEAAAYLAVADAVRDATDRGASFASVTSACLDGTLVVEVTDDGVPAPLPGPAVTDRVGALGGRLAVRDPHTLWLEFPCA